jgi:hypothetical protein
LVVLRQVLVFLEKAGCPIDHIADNVGVVALGVGPRGVISGDQLNAAPE